MAKLKGKAKEEFLARMAKGRRKAARTNPKRKARTKGKRPQSRKTPRQKHMAAMQKVVRTGKGQQRLAKTRARVKNAGPRSVRKSKKAMKKFLPGFVRKRRRNQEGGIEEAAQMFEQFHGKPPGRIVEYDQTYTYPGNFAELGKLKELRFDLDSRNKDFPLTNFGQCQTVCTPDGSNIYFIGGDQRIDFDALNIASDKDMVELGPATYIMYHTVKGFHDFNPTDYFHRFGEEDGILPVLAYDRLNHTLFLIGGNYRVRPEGIVN